jgi:tetratricopeptide (TPR) repeat protein
MREPALNIPGIARALAVALTTIAWVLPGSAFAQLAGTPGGQKKVDGRLADRGGQTAGDLASAAYKSFVTEDFKDAEITARLALQADGQNARANAVLGNVLAVLGVLDDDAARVARARDYSLKALARDPKLALAHNALGVALAGEGNLSEAQAEFTRAIELDEGLAVAQGNLAWVHWQRKRFLEAERMYRLAIRLDPERAVPYNGLATVLGSLGRYEEMERASRDAIRRYEPRDRILASLYVNLAVALHEQNQHEAAIGAVARARALGLPNHPAYEIIQGLARLDP